MHGSKTELGKICEDSKESRSLSCTVLNSCQNDGIPNPQNFNTNPCMSSLCGHYNKNHLFQDFQSLLVYYNKQERRGFKEADENKGFINDSLPRGTGLQGRYFPPVCLSFVQSFSWFSLQPIKQRKVFFLFPSCVVLFLYSGVSGSCFSLFMPDSFCNPEDLCGTRSTAVRLVSFVWSLPPAPVNSSQANQH